MTLLSSKNSSVPVENTSPSKAPVKTEGDGDFDESSDDASGSDDRAAKKKATKNTTSSATMKKRSTLADKNADEYAVVSKVSLSLLALRVAWVGGSGGGRRTDVTDVISTQQLIGGYGGT